jgi:hypothetical protein
MWVAPWSALRLVTSPISMVAAIVGRQRNIMFVKVGSLLFRIASMYAGYYWWDGRAVEALSIASALNTLMLLYLFCRMAGVRLRALGSAFFLAPAAAAVAGWLASDAIATILP